MRWNPWVDFVIVVERVGRLGKKTMHSGLSGEKLKFDTSTYNKSANIILNWGYYDDIGILCSRSW